MYQHRVIQGRVYRVVQVDAADTREAAQHVMAERPTAERDRRELREFIEATK